MSADGELFPDTVVCSGLKVPELDGKACPYSDEGRFPLPQVREESDSSRSSEQEGDLTPSCAITELGRLYDWQDLLGKYPRDMHDLRVFKCKQMLLFVIPGLTEDNKLIDAGELVGSY